MRLYLTQVNSICVTMNLHNMYIECYYFIVSCACDIYIYIYIERERERERERDRPHRSQTGAT